MESTYYDTIATQCLAPIQDGFGYEKRIAEIAVVAVSAVAAISSGVEKQERVDSSDKVDDEVLFRLISTHIARPSVSLAAESR